MLLSFGQRLNKRLHYSFGTDDNSELPHIAFPLISSVDSLVSVYLPRWSHAVIGVYRIFIMIKFYGAHRRIKNMVYRI